MLLIVVPNILITLELVLVSLVVLFEASVASSFLSQQYHCRRSHCSDLVLRTKKLRPKGSALILDQRRADCINSKVGHRNQLWKKM